MITVKTIISLPVNEVWKFWTSPEHIANWNNVDENWHTPRVEIDLKEGGYFLYRMESKDATQAFDHKGVFNKIELYQRIEYTLVDGRRSIITFTDLGYSVEITEAFDPETETPVVLQREFCNRILNSFKSYAETTSNKIKYNGINPEET